MVCGIMEKDVGSRKSKICIRLYKRVDGMDGKSRG